MSLQKVIKKRSEKSIQDMIRFFIDFWSILEPNLAPRSPPDPQLGAQEEPILISFLIDFGNNLGRFWEGFGGQVGTKLAPNGTRTRPHNQSTKMITFWKAYGTNFNQFLADLGTNWGGPGGSNESAFWTFFGSWGQDPPKTPPRAPQEAPRAPKSPILVDFW